MNILDMNVGHLTLMVNDYVRCIYKHFIIQHIDTVVILTTQQLKVKLVLLTFTHTMPVTASISIFRHSDWCHKCRLMANVINVI